MSEPKESFSFESSDLIDFFIKRFRPLAFITLVGAVVSIIVALTIEPRFKSTVVLFPASSSSISNDLLSANQGKKDILKFGEEEEVEQMMQVLFSDEIRDAVIRKFNLMQHYKIDSTEMYPLTKMHKKFRNNISFRRTEYMSIEINVLDTDPQLAADIANSLAAFIDTAMNRMKQDRALLALRLVEKEYFSLRDEMTEMEDSLKVLQQLGINNYESQAEVFNDAYAQAVLSGKDANIKKLEEKIKILSDHGVAYTSIRNKLIYETERLSNLKAKYIEARVDYEQSLPHKFVVDNAVKAEKKSKPVRWLIVSVSTFATFIFGLVMLILLEGVVSRIKKYRS
jgi:uncharacterized protein involved in exopolysaccharide biosynthesis